MLVVRTPKRPPRGRRALILRSCNTLVCLRLCQPSWAPWMCDLPRSACSYSLVSLLGRQGFYVMNEGLSEGCALDGPAKYFWVLGRYTLETFLRSACLEWLCQTLCIYAGYLGVSTLHTFKNQQIFDFIINQPWTSQLQLRHHRRPLHVMRFSRSSWVSSDTGHR
jgi:hypothetical protein